MKTYTIKDGAVIEVSPIMRGLSSPEVEASTKTEATSKLLAMAAQILANSPKLYWRNGAMLLTYPNGTGFAVEASTPARAMSNGQIMPLCSGQCDNEREAINGSSFAYYASDEYQNQAKQAIA